MRLAAALALVLALVVALDPYEVLGVSRDADDKTIKLAYRQLLKQYHPDKNALPEAHDKFIEIGEAYDILSDPQKKQNFDRFGSAGGQQQGGAGFDFGDIFSNFFQQGQGQQARKRGQDTTVNINMLLREAFLGKDFEFDVEMNNLCGKCSGSGSEDGQRHRCSKCGGTGVVQRVHQMGPIVQTFQSQCDQCGGKGSVIAKRCHQCGGHGTERKARHYAMRLEPGTPPGHRIVMEGEGDQNPEWEAGNMNLVFHEASDDNWGFRRVGRHLYRTEVVTLREAAAGGWTREIRFFDDEAVAVGRRAGQTVMDGEVDVVKGHGMPILGEDDYGDLFVLYKVIPVASHKAKQEL